jgi:hypothetical protein
MRTYRKGDPVLAVGSISGLTLRNIQVADSTSVGILISGFPGHVVQDVQFENISIKLKGEINESKEGNTVLPEQVVSYPEVWMFGPIIPAYGAYLRHASKIRMSNMEIKVELPDQRPALICDDVQDIDIKNLPLTGDPHSEWVATLHNSRGVNLDGITMAHSAKFFARIQGAECERIRLRNLEVEPQSQLFRLEDGAIRKAILSE